MTRNDEEITIKRALVLLVGKSCDNCLWKETCKNGPFCNECDWVHEDNLDEYDDL